MDGRLFYESTESTMHSPNFSKIAYINISTAEQFYQNTIKINDMLLEVHTDIQKYSALSNKIMNANNFKKLQPIELYKQFKIQLPIYIFKFDFANPTEIINIFHSFDIKFSLKQGTLKEKHDFEIQAFKQLYKECTGLFTNCGTCTFMFFNINSYTKTTVQHELMHYIQYISSDNEDLLFDENITLDELCFDSIDKMEYIFDKKQFEAHIKVDLVNQLEQLYYIKYKNKLTKSQFCTNFINFIREQKSAALDKFIPILQKLKNNDTTSLRIFIACFLIKNKKYLNRAIQWLQEAFN